MEIACEVRMFQDSKSVLGGRFVPPKTFRKPSQRFVDVKIAFKSFTLRVKSARLNLIKNHKTSTIFDPIPLNQRFNEVNGCIVYCLRV